MKTLKEVTAITEGFAYRGGGDREEYWYWRGWEVALGGKPVGPIAEIYHQYPEYLPIYQMGYVDAIGELELRHED